METKMKKSKDEVIQEIKDLSVVEKKMREVNAVSLGFPVTSSSFLNGDHINYPLDFNNQGAHCWQAKQNKVGEWIQVCSENPKYWTAVIMQGRGNEIQWVTEVKFTSSLNGAEWSHIDGGKTF